MQTKTKQKAYLLVTIKSVRIECKLLRARDCADEGRSCLNKFGSEIRRSTSRRAVTRLGQRRFLSPHRHQISAFLLQPLPRTVDLCARRRCRSSCLHPPAGSRNPWVWVPISTPERPAQTSAGEAHGTGRTTRSRNSSTSEHRLNRFGVRP
jgi:hypothetical protein